MCAFRIELAQPALSRTLNPARVRRAHNNSSFVSMYIERCTAPYITIMFETPEEFKTKCCATKCDSIYWDHMAVTNRNETRISTEASITWMYQTITYVHSCCCFCTQITHSHGFSDVRISDDNTFSRSYDHANRFQQKYFVLIRTTICYQNLKLGWDLLPESDINTNRGNRLMILTPTVATD